MITKAQRVRLGIFISVGTLFLLVFLIVVAGSKLMERRDTYYIMYNDVSVNGLQIGGQVKYHGIQVGRIENISIHPKDVSKIIVEISIQHGTPIMQDVIAKMVLVGITGLKQIELTGGSKQEALLKPGSYIKSGPSAMDAITGKAEAIATKVELLLNNIIEITNEENRSHISNVLKTVDQVVTEGAPRVNNAVAHVDSITYNLAKISRQANQTIARINQIVNSQQTTNILNNVETFSDKVAAIDLQKTVDDINLLIANLNATVNQTTILVNRLDSTVLKARPEIQATVESLRETVEYLNEFSRQISEDPSLLIKSKRPTK